MRTARAALFTAIIFALPTIAWAQGEGSRSSSKKSKRGGASAPARSSEPEPEPEPDPAAEAPAAATAAPAPEAAPAVQRVESAPPSDGRFRIRRGFFAEADLGVFFTFGGRNTNDPALPKRVTSNVEPQLGVNVGYDVAHGQSFNFALGLKFAMGFSGGAARVQDTEIMAGTDVETKSNDYSVTEIGVMAALSFLLTDRLALSIRADGGAGILDPDPSKVSVEAPPCAEGATMIENGSLCVVPGSGSAAFAPVVGGGLGLEYFTLLNDFSLGLLLRFQGIMASGGMIPGMTVTIPIKYTF